nr:MAG TPA: hypothetical protein [Caudoviricetes sp.]
MFSICPRKLLLLCAFRVIYSITKTKEGKSHDKI